MLGEYLVLTTNAAAKSGLLESKIPVVKAEHTSD